MNTTELFPPCACHFGDARQCFLSRHPECDRKSDIDFEYDEAIDERCSCSCHLGSPDAYTEYE